MTRGHRGSLLLRCRAFSSLSSCRFIPAHPTFHAEAADRARATYPPDTAWPVNGFPPGSSRTHSIAPVLMPSKLFDASSVVHLRSSSRSLSDALRAPFPQRSPQQSLANLNGSGSPGGVTDCAGARVSAGVSVCCVSGGGRRCPVCPGAHRLRPRRDGSPSVLQGPLVLVRRVRAWRIAAASR